MKAKSIIRRIPLVLGALALMVSGLAAVSAYESHVVNVQAHVENALTTPVELIDLGTVFPEEFIIAEVGIQLSPSFLAEEAVTGVTFDVWVHCKDASFNVEWMGDAAYLAGSDPGSTLPGGGAAGTDPSAGTPNTPWFAAGGSATNCPGGATPGNLAKVITGVTVDKSDLPGGSDESSVFLGLDVPVCDFNYNPDTDVKPKPSGYDEPTVVLISGDPRWEDQATDKECDYDIGMDVKCQVTGIARTP